MSSTPRNTSSDSSANGAARRVVAARSAERPRLDRRHRDDLLGQHVERVARVARGLDVGGQHALGDDRGLEQVAPVLRDQLAHARRAHLVAGATDPLQTARDRDRRLDLHDQVDRAHVDARARATTWRRWRGSMPPLSASSTSTRCSRASEPWWARAISSSASSFSVAASRSALRRLLTNTIVERCVRIRSSSTGWIEGQIEERSMPPRSSGGLPTRLMSSIGTMTSRSSCLRTPASITVDVAGEPGRLEPAEEPRDLVQRALGGRQTDPLERALGSRWRAVRATASGARRAWSRPSRGSRR